MKLLDRNEYPARRQRLIEQLHPNSVALIPSAAASLRNGDVEHPFRQDSDFYYLTGFAEEQALLVLVKNQDSSSVLLFCQDKIVEQEIWTGRRLGADAAPSILQVDQAYTIDQVDEIMPNLLDGKQRIYTSLGANSAFDQQVLHWHHLVKQKVRTGSTAPHQFSTLEHLLHEMRLIKSDAEISQMQEAADISAKAHCQAMLSVAPGMFEYQLEAEMNRIFMSAGSRWPAYPSIVGSGDNACILHYTANNQTIDDGDLILIDAGCELDYYASDITRTFPANGRFNESQAALYQLVLDAQSQAIAAVKPGNHWDQPHQAAVTVLTKGLVQLGLIKLDPEYAGQQQDPSSEVIADLIEQQAYRPFYMHKTGHWLGMDVHDVGDYRVNGEWRQLQPGMVMTVEPGIYVAPDNEDVDECWRGIGIRIEDDVVVTEQGCHVLTDGVVKEIADIEALMATTESPTNIAKVGS
jgi:Xaa-Pro aminopeptidase